MDEKKSQDQSNKKDLSKNQDETEMPKPNLNLKSLKVDVSRQGVGFSKKI